MAVQDRWCELNSRTLVRLRVFSHLQFASFGPDKRHKKISAVAFFSHFGSFFTPRCWLRPVTVDELVKRTKMQQRKSCENIRITHGPALSWNVFPKLLFRWSE